MDTQPMPPNPAGSERPPSRVSPEDLQTGAHEAPASPEMASAPGSAPPPAAPPQATPSSAALTADDVTAAIAAVPGPTGPAGVVPTPTMAGDVDVIEPEWVDKAEEVVRAHQGDPYGEEEAIEDLQQDYLKKRYGFNVADPKSDSSKPEGS